MIKTRFFFVFLIGLVASCANMKNNQLFVDNDKGSDIVPTFNASTEIYHDFLSSESWFTYEDHCLQVKAIEEAAYDGDLGLQIIWDKQAEDCPWLGIGFGWDNWTGKDLSSNYSNGAVSFWVKMLDGERKDLPWAIGLEDFTGAQAWLGMSTNAVKAEKITSEWTRIELPLCEFNWAEQNADISNIKQIIFNLEADGNIYLDEIQIAPYDGGYRKRAKIPLVGKGTIKVDGIKDDEIWNTMPYEFGDNKVHLSLVDSFLCVALEIKDLDPMQNVNQGAEIFNGDAFEIAFSTDPDAILQRTRFLSTDQHIGFSIGEKINSWDFRKHKQLESYIAASSKTPQGYIFELKINLKEFGIDKFEEGRLYGLEMVVDHGNKKGRQRQDRWNGDSDPNFFKNPFVWGEMIIYNPIMEVKNL